jgi:uncharacterized protein involved in outer membrane biogenesis
MRSLFKGLLVIGALLVLLFAGGAWYLSTLDFNEYNDEIEKAITDATGRQFRIAGNTTLDVLPDPKVVFERVSLANAEWGTKPEFLSVERLEAEISLIDLLGGELEIKQVVLVRPSILLETDAKGRKNWAMSLGDPESASAPAEAGPIAVDLSHAEIRDANIVYRDGATDSTHVLDIEELLINRKGWRQPLDIVMRGRYDDRPFEVTGETGTLFTLIRNEPYAFDVKVNAGGADISAKGSVDEPMNGRGIKIDLGLKSPNLGELLKLAAVESPVALPVGLNGRIRDDQNRYVWENFELTLGKSDLSGSASLETVKDRTVIKAALKSNLMDLDELLPPSTPEQKPRQDGRLIPADPLPLEALRAVDAEVSFNGARVVVSGLELTGLATELELRAGKLRLKPTAELYGGKASGEFNLDAAARTPSVKTDLKATKVNLGALVNAIKGSEILSGGESELTLDLSGAGSSPRAIAASMNGGLITKIGPGRINNDAIDTVGADALMGLMRAVNPGDQSDDFTALKCGVVKFDVKKGIATTERGIAAETERMNVTGSGTVDFKTEKLDIAIRTEPREGVGLSASSLAGLVRVGGTLADPTPEVDAVGASKVGASAVAAVATGGLSLLAQGLYSRASADEAPCDTALGIKKPKPPRTASRISSRSDDDDPTAHDPNATRATGETSESSESLGDALKGVGDSIKGLFGN